MLSIFVIHSLKYICCSTSLVTFTCAAFLLWRLCLVCYLCSCVRMSVWCFNVEKVITRGCKWNETVSSRNPTSNRKSNS
jgi:hypothetical protein